MFQITNQSTNTNIKYRKPILHYEPLFDSTMKGETPIFVILNLSEMLDWQTRMMERGVSRFKARSLAFVHAVRTKIVVLDLALKSSEAGKYRGYVRKSRSPLP